VFFSFESNILIALLSVSIDLEINGPVLFVCLLKEDGFTWTKKNMFPSLAVQLLIDLAGMFLS
jgi:hypothetical protein